MPFSVLLARPKSSEGVMQPLCKRGPRGRHSSSNPPCTRPPSCALWEPRPLCIPFVILATDKASYTRHRGSLSVFSRIYTRISSLQISCALSFWSGQVVEKGIILEVNGKMSLSMKSRLRTGPFVFYTRLLAPRVKQREEKWGAWEGMAWVGWYVTLRYRGGPALPHSASLTFPSPVWQPT